MRYLIKAMQRALLAAGCAALISVPASAGEYKGPNLKGQTVTIAGPWLTGDKDSYDAVNAYFEKLLEPRWIMQVRTVLNSRS